VRLWRAHPDEDARVSGLDWLSLALLVGVTAVLILAISWAEVRK
jgi:hypothetical protein